MSGKKTDIQCNRLDRGFELYQEEFEQKAIEVLRSGWYVLGAEGEAFEREFASYLGVRHCAGVASGLDALQLAFRILGVGEGDEVIVQGNTYIASVMGITMNGATPVFAEPDEYFNLDADRLEEKITERTKAILAVHLYGQASNMGPIMELAKRRRLRVVEDCAQSHGARFGGRMTGTFGDIACFSFYPTKNLGAFGDGGAIVTDSDEMDQKARILRNYGSSKKYYFDEVGINSRLDEIQAGLLRVKLRHLDELIGERKEICGRYLREIQNPEIELPGVRPGAESIWHQFVIRTERRDELARALAGQGIQTIIHYPIPPHLTEAYRYLKLREGSLPVTERYSREALSLPLYNGMRKNEIDRVIEAVNRFKSGEESSESKDL